MPATPKPCQHKGKVYWDGPHFDNVEEGARYIGQMGVFVKRCHSCDADLDDSVGGPGYPERYVGTGSFSHRIGDFYFEPMDGRE